MLIISHFLKVYTPQKIGKPTHSIVLSVLKLSIISNFKNTTWEKN